MSKDRWTYHGEPLSEAEIAAAKPLAARQGVSVEDFLAGQERHSRFVGEIKAAFDRCYPDKADHGLLQLTAGCIAAVLTSFVQYAPGDLEDARGFIAGITDSLLADFEREGFGGPEQ